jgi:hypothetical protein
MKTAAIIAKIKTAWIQFRCSHQTEFVRETPNGSTRRQVENHTITGPAIAISNWSEPEPHPVPKFSATHKIQRQRTAHVCHCKKCGKTWVEFGHNQKDVSDQTAEVVPFIAAEVAKEIRR